MGFLRWSGRIHCAIGRLRCRAVLSKATDAKARWNVGRFRGPQKVLEVTIFGEDVCERFVHYFVSGSVEVSGVLIDLPGGSFVEPDRGRDLADLNDLKQRHDVAPCGVTLGSVPWRVFAVVQLREFSGISPTIGTRKLEPMPSFQRGQNVCNRPALGQPEFGRSDI